MMSEVAISWSSKKHLVASISTTEAEFIPATTSSCQVVWLKQILKALEKSKQALLLSIMITILLYVMIQFKGGNIRCFE